MLQRRYLEFFFADGAVHFVRFHVMHRDRKNRRVGIEFRLADGAHFVRINVIHRGRKTDQVGASLFRPTAPLIS